MEEKLLNQIDREIVLYLYLYIIYKTISWIGVTAYPLDKCQLNKFSQFQFKMLSLDHWKVENEHVSL